MQALHGISGNLFSIVTIAILIMIVLITWHKMRQKKRRHVNYLSFQLDKHNKDFTFSDYSYDDGVGAVVVREKEHEDPEEIFTGSPTPPKETPPTWPKTIALYIKTKPHELFYGYDLMQAILNLGFVHGHLQFFHYGDAQKTLFSLTSLDPPGGFQLDNMGGFKTTGLCLFMQPHRFQQPVLVFEQMVHIAEQIAEELGGVVEDEHHHLLTPERLNHWRSTLSDTPDES